VVLDRAGAAQADPGSQVAADKSDLTSSLGVMGAAAAMTALFVISSTFAFAVAHRRRETAVMRALGATPGQLASTAISANRTRAGAIAMPIVLITALVGAGVVFEQTDARFAQHVTTKRVTAPRVLIASSGAGLPLGTVTAVRALPGVRGATGELDTQVFLLDKGLTNNGEPRPAAGLDGGRLGATPGLDLAVRAGSLANVHGDVIAIANSVAAPAHLHVSQLLHASMIDLRRITLRIGAIYNNAAGLGVVVMDPSLAQAHATDKLDNAIHVTGGPAADRALARYARLHPELAVQSRAQFLADVHVPRSTLAGSPGSSRASPQRSPCSA
jgi:putative ABC transport system permease protein